jgi:hypothetical protein
LVSQHGNHAQTIGEWRCSPDNSTACENASKLGNVLLWISAAIYLIGFCVAYVLGPILTKLDIG